VASGPDGRSRRSSLVSASSKRRLSIGSGRCPLASFPSRSRAAWSTGGGATGAPARSAASRSSSALGGLAARARAFSIVSSVSSLKLARVRLRGPAGVLRDSRISKLPLLVGTTNAIVGK
jgi:hypothetical protein